MKALEEDLGILLFERHARGVRLTEAGRHFVERVTTGIDHLDHAVRTAGKVARGKHGSLAGSPNLLTDICHCGNCGGAMTLRTGKNGRYRYYACSIRARQGDAGCKGRAISMDKLDRMVVTHIEERLLDPERLEDMLASLLDRRQEGVERRSQHITELHQRAAEADMRLKRLYDAIEAGSLDPAESALGERIAGLTALRDQARTDAARIEAMLKSSAHQGLTGAAVRELATEARSRLRHGKGGYRRDHVRAFAQRVEVADDAIRIMGTIGARTRRRRCPI